MAAMKSSLLGLPRKKSLNNGTAIDLRLTIDPIAPLGGHSERHAVDQHHIEPAASGLPVAVDGDIKMPDSPRQPTMSLMSEAPVTESLVESACDLNQKDRVGSGSVAGRARRSSATMRSFLQRVMRSQSESQIRIAPVSQFNDDPRMLNSLTPPVSGREQEDVSRSVVASDQEVVGVKQPDNDQDQGDEGEELDDPEDTTAKTFANAYLEKGQVLDKCRTDEAVGLCDVFLNSSLQLLQVQSDTKQRIRQLWTCAQRLRWENQISDSGLELLHQELLNVMKALTVEKLEGARHIKAGYLTLLQAPPAVVAANMMQRGAAAATKSLLFGAKSTLDQRVWVSLSEEQCRIEFGPARNEPSTNLPAQEVHPSQPAATTPDSQSQQTTQQSLPPLNGAATFPGIGKFKLPTSISWLLSDPLQQQKEEEATWVGPTTIKLQGCQVRRLPPAPTASAPDSTRGRFQILVPNSDPRAPAVSTTVSSLAPGVSTAVVPDQNPSSSFGVYVFEATGADVEAAEQERDDWIRTIDRVCMFSLYALETRLRDACYMLQYRDILASCFPVCVPLTWLRNRLERMPTGTNGTTMTAQQQATYQQQQQQRRSSRNLSMVQIVKDLERDKILVDHKLLISCLGRQQRNASPSQDSADRTKILTTLSDGTIVVEHDSVGEIVKYLVAKAMAFAKRSGLSKSKPNGKPPTCTSPSSTSETVGPSSPSNRLTKFTEARALAFVERVLRGSSRTQSGGDIYDAISFFCQQRNLSICPMSHDAHPVQLNVVEEEDEGVFHIEIEVSMQFKVVELALMTPRGDSELPDVLTATTPREWAVLEGTLLRQFTLGKLSEPGSVTVKYLPDIDNGSEDMDASSGDH